MKVGNLLSILEKVGNMQFDSKIEKEGFAKIAQGVPMDPQAMGMPPMADPSMVDPQVQGQVPQGISPEQQASIGMSSSSYDADAVIGESITNSDIESLIKVINILTSLKSKYDIMKKQQMDLIKQQTEEQKIPGPGPGEMPAQGPVQAPMQG